MDINIKKYNTFVFDCDGVVLNSNKVKTEAYYKTILPYGEEAASEFIDYHVRHGGVSRFKKFEYFLKNIVKEKPTTSKLEKLLQAYASEVINGLLNCEIAQGLKKFRKITSNKKWLLVSGGKQQELKTVFSKRGIDNLFNGGIFGSPDAKEEILKREIEKRNIVFPALFIGDTEYDYKASSAFNLDFLFLYEWSEFKDWKEYFNDKDVYIKKSISDIIHA